MCNWFDSECDLNFRLIQNGKGVGYKIFIHSGNEKSIRDFRRLNYNTRTYIVDQDDWIRWQDKLSQVDPNISGFCIFKDLREAREYRKLWTDDCGDVTYAIHKIEYSGAFCSFDLGDDHYYPIILCKSFKILEEISNEEN
jgi:hypothetical protein